MQSFLERSHQPDMAGVPHGSGARIGTNANVEAYDRTDTGQLSDRYGRMHETLNPTDL
jgi:hypothetical protein